MFISLSCYHEVIDLMQNSPPLFTYVLFALRPELSKILWEAFLMLILFSSIKGTTHVYLLQASITYNKKQNPFLHLFITSISARSAPQMLSLKDEYNFGFSYFLIIGLCDSSINCCFYINSETTSELILVPWCVLEDFLSKNL